MSKRNNNPSRNNNRKSRRKNQFNGQQQAPKSNPLSTQATSVDLFGDGKVTFQFAENLRAVNDMLSFKMRNVMSQGAPQQPASEAARTRPLDKARALTHRTEWAELMTTESEWAAATEMDFERVQAAATAFNTLDGKQLRESLMTTDEFEQLQVAHLRAMTEWARRASTDRIRVRIAAGSGNRVHAEAIPINMPASELDAGFDTSILTGWNAIQIAQHIGQADFREVIDRQVAGTDFLYSRGKTFHDLVWEEIYTPLSTAQMEDPDSAYNAQQLSEDRELRRSAWQDNIDAPIRAAVYELGNAFPPIR